MSSSQSSHEKNPSSCTSKDYNYLEKKYGKEPKISEEELKRTRWSWH